MKRLGILLLVLTLTLGFVACGAEEPKNEEVIVEVPPTSEIPEDTNEEKESEEEEPIALEEPLIVMDAAQYRGTVVSIEGELEKTIVLEQYEGTNFGRKRIDVHITEDTKANFDLERLEEEQYLEVYYGLNTEETTVPTTVEAIAVNYLGTAEERNFNAIVVSVNVSEENPDEGSILVTDLHGGNETQVNYNSDGTTQMYLNMDEVTEGTRLNIFHRPMMTMSLPPQIFGEEIRLYVSEEEASQEVMEEIKEEEDQNEASDAINPELENIV